MFLKTLSLANFRNYSKLEFKFGTPITILVGDNAQGKSNFLESIYFLATAKSPKADREDELVQSGETVLRIEGGLEDRTLMEIIIQIVDPETSAFKKRVRINGVPRRVLDYISNVKVVYFSPEDINLVIGSPSLRRNYMDSVLSQVDRDYKRAISNYESIITNKNRLLKRIREGLAKKDELIFWSDQQVLLGTLISSKRLELFEYLNSIEKKFGEFEYIYKENKLSTERLIEYQPREIASANSLIGPHRDDFLFTLSESDLSKYGSRGQQRISVLDLKIAEVGFIEQRSESRPILLLDDIFSELDHHHQQHVLELSRLQQTVITAVELDEHLKKEFAKEDVKFFEVQQGGITSLQV